jgi:hypothetical protein
MRPAWALSLGVCFMGAGCYYTLPQNRDILAYWVDVTLDDEDRDLGWDDSDFHDVLLDDLKSCILELPLSYDKKGTQIYYGKHYIIELEPTYYGDGILIHLSVDLEDWRDLYPLMYVNLEKVYNKIVKHINKSFSLKRAAGSWCSSTIKRGEL